MDRSGLLQGLHSPEALHDSLSPTQGQMRVFDSVVLPPSHTPPIINAQLSQRSKLGFEPVGHDLDWASMAFQCLLEESHCS